MSKFNHIKYQITVVVDGTCTDEMFKYIQCNINDSLDYDVDSSCYWIEKARRKLFGEGILNMQPKVRSISIARERKALHDPRRERIKRKAESVGFVVIEPHQDTGLHVVTTSRNDFRDPRLVPKS